MAYGQGYGAGPEYVPDRVLVKFRPGTPASEKAKAHAAVRSAVIDEIPGIGVQVVKLPRALSVARGLGHYLHNPNVQYAEPDYYAEAQMTVPNDPWYLNGQRQLPRIQAPQAWDITRGRDDAMIAVLDTGLDYTHPDAQGRYVLGWDFANNDGDPWDDNNHGTWVYGVVGAATNNGAGIASVSWYNPVLVVKIADYTGMASCISSGIVYAADAGCRAANISFGGPGYSQTWQDAIDYAWARGMVTVCAAGNSGNSTPIYPASSNHAVSIAAIDGYDVIYSYSSYGPYIDLCAPGSAYTLGRGGLYGTVGGTSIAAPYVAGAVGLVASVNPSLSAEQIVDILEQTADDLGAPGWDQYYGWGRINPYQAVLAAQATPAGDFTPPTVSLTSPVSGSAVTGTTQIVASATDNVGVTKVEFYLDGNLLGSDSVGPFTWSWNTTTVADGAHTLSAAAHDAAGNVGESTAITVFVDNSPPKASIVTPTSGASLSATALVEASASDQVLVSRVDFYLDGQKKQSASAAPYRWNWDTTASPNGGHTLVARAFDGAGNYSDSSAVPVTVQNAATQVTETFTGRAGGSLGNATVWVTTGAAGPLQASLTCSGKGSLSLYLYNAAGSLLASNTSGANPKAISLALPSGTYRFVTGSSRNRLSYTLTVTHS
jgi:subtilisin family serine protease